MSVEVGCHNCAGACCQASILIELNEQELTTMRSAGTLLEKIEDTSRRGIRLGSAVTSIAEYNMYRFVSDCRHLDIREDSPVRLCGLFGQDSRPSACGAFPMGEENCLTVRLTHRVDDFEEFIENRHQLDLRRLNAAAGEAGTATMAGA